MSPTGSTKRVRAVLLVIVIAAVVAFGFYRSSSLQSAEVQDKVHPSFANPPTALATAPIGAAPHAWWTNLLVIAEHDGVAYVFLGLVLVAALLNVTSPAEAKRLRASVVCFLGYVVTIPIAAAMLSAESLSVYGQVRFVGLLLEGIAVVNGLAIFALDIALRVFHFKIPRILADVILAGSYLALGLALLTRAGFNVSGLIATSAVLTAVIGLSVQDTLGNIMSGLVLEMEDAINPGDWIKVNDVVGRVKEIRWRWTSIETRNWDTVVIPNAVLMKNQVTVFGRRTGAPLQHRQWVWFTVELSVAPSIVIDTVELALRASPIPRVAAEPPPNCILMEFKDGVASYAVRYWLNDLAVDDPTDSSVRERIYYALARSGIRLAFPAHAISLTEEDEERAGVRAREELKRRIDVLSRVELFKVLERGELEELAPRLRHAPFGKGEVMTRQGAQAHWLYLILSGKATVQVAKDGTERHVGDLCAGEVFGEMALLTGEARSATVIAATAVECWRLDREGFEIVIKRRPELARELSRILALRKVGLEAAQQDMNRDTGKLGRIGHHEKDILRKISAFFGLSEIEEELRA